MYAIIEDGGKQYKVSEGDALLIERRDLDEGQTELTFDKVLMVGDGAESRIGTPWVNGATVTAKVMQALKTARCSSPASSHASGSSSRDTVLLNQWTTFAPANRLPCFCNRSSRVAR